MTESPITVRPDTDYLAAIAIMRAGKMRRLPVVDENGRLAGIISASTLQNIQIPDDSRERVIQAGGVLVRIGDVMTRDVITVSPDYPLEEAADLMIEHKIGFLPVVEDDQLVGVITDTDIFRVLVQVLGGGSASIRICVEVDNKPGEFSQVAKRVASVGGNIFSVASLPAESDERIKLTMRIEDVSLEELLEAVKTHPNIDITNVWDAR
jgi:acetoin utilization protein AcuB